jgi:hypothetical protein
MRRTVQVDPRKLGRYENWLAGMFRERRVRSALAAAGKASVQMLEVRSQHINYKNRFRRSWYWVVRGGDKLVIGNHQPYAQFVEFGRRANKAMPPLAVIREWCIVKGLGPQAAFPVARKIAIQGIAARPVLGTADMTSFIELTVNSHLTSWLDSMLLSGVDR